LTLVNDKLDLFGRTLVGKAQVLKFIPIQMLWRRPTAELKIIQNTIKKIVSK